MALTTCLWFDTQAEEAAQFYATVFPNSSVGAIARYGPEAPDREGTALTVEFTVNGQQFTGLNGGPTFTFTPAISFQVPCETQDEVDAYWNVLAADGGEPGQCGWIQDKFGLSWQIIPNRLPELMADPDRDRANRAVAAMMQMGKLDIAELERAADGVAV